MTCCNFVVGRRLEAISSRTAHLKNLIVRGGLRGRFCILSYPRIAATSPFEYFFGIMALTGGSIYVFVCVALVVVGLFYITSRVVAYQSGELWLGAGFRWEGVQLSS